MKHGGDLLSYADYYKGELIDFSSNINPLGVPEILERVLIDNFKNIEAYPDIEYRKLKSSVSKYLGCESGGVLLGNGAMEIIDIFTRISNRVITMLPSFSEYKERALINKRQVVSIEYKDDFTIDLDKLERVLKSGDLMILGNPNNPTGLRINRDLLIELYTLVRKKDAILLLDEAFFEFVPEDYDSVDLFRSYKYENLGIIRAATKFFAIPGLRLGYGLTSQKIKEKLLEYQMPWTINVFADIAGQYIFDDKKYIKDSKEYIARERRYLLERLNGIEYLKAYESHSNYILIKLLKYDEAYVFKSLLKDGLLVRKCSSFTTLGENHIRIAVKNRGNNEKLISALKKIKGGL